MNGWWEVLGLDSGRVPTAGSAAELRSAIGRGVDLRIDTEFRHNEPGSPNAEILREVRDFRVTYLVEER